MSTNRAVAEAAPPAAPPAPRQSRLVYQSAVASLVVQVVVAGVTAAGFLVEVPDDLMLIFALELGSQVIEFLWYLVVVCRYRTIATWTRYIDWVLSTPLMLATTALFFVHRRAVDFDWTSPRLYAVLALNWLMLAFGFAAEVDATSRPLALTLGAASLVGSFTVLATYVERDDVLSVVLFAAMYAVWGLYGAAAMLGDTAKNVGYNALDVVSKNFYGIFLFAYALSL